jgi:ParB family chromosome partitioning protein
MAKRHSVANLIEEDFDSALAAKKRHDTIQNLRQQLDLTQKEVEKREQLLNEFRSQLEQRNGKILVPISHIVPSDQCRKTFTEAVILKRVESLRREGQLDSLILIPLIDQPNRYQLEDGEVTWRAAKYLVEAGEGKWQSLEAVISPLVGDSRDIHRRSLLHHLHSESLNSLDRAESIIRELNWSVDLEIDEAEIEAGQSRFEAGVVKLKKILRNLDYQFRKNEAAHYILQQIDRATREEQQLTLEQLELNPLQIEIILVLLDFQIELHSFVANDLAMISLPDDLKQAVRQRDLPCHQAKALGKLTAKKLNKDESEAIEIRTKAVERVLSDALSVKDTRKLVAEILSQHEGEKSKPKEKTSEQYQQVKQSLSKLAVKQLKSTQLKSLKKAMEKKLEEIDSLLEN